MPFAIRKGDILAKSVSITIPIDDSELEKPLTSIFNILSYESLENQIDPDFEKHIIDIRLKPDVFRTYYKLREYDSGSYIRALNGLVVLPVLTEAISLVLNAGDEQDSSFGKYRWYRAIVKKLKDINVDITNCHESTMSLANRLLGDVVNDALVVFMNVIHAEFGYGDDHGGGDE